MASLHRHRASDRFGRSADTPRPARAWPLVEPNQESHSRVWMVGYIGVGDFHLLLFAGFDRRTRILNFCTMLRRTMSHRVCGNPSDGPGMPFSSTHKKSKATGDTGKSATSKIEKLGNLGRCRRRVRHRLLPSQGTARLGRLNPSDSDLQRIVARRRIRAISARRCVGWTIQTHSCLAIAARGPLGTAARSVDTVQPPPRNWRPHISPGRQGPPMAASPPGAAVEMHDGLVGQVKAIRQRRQGSGSGDRHPCQDPVGTDTGRQQQTKSCR